MFRNKIAVTKNRPPNRRSAWLVQVRDVAAALAAGSALLVSCPALAVRCC
jgi:gluconate kinase